MAYTADQVLALAPDSGSAANGRTLANAHHWRALGRSDAAVWGECQGSAVYQVRAELASMAVKCTCPSHKFPCKHGLALLLLAADPGAMPQAEPPEWVASWLAKRAAPDHAKPAKAPTPSGAGTPTAPTKDQQRRIEKREALIAQGLAALDLWLADLVRGGLAAVEGQSSAFWERPAAQLVDAQAPGLAARLRRMAEIPGSSDDWPNRLLAQLGRLALLTHAYRRAEVFDPPLREDVREMAGWFLKEDEVAARGEHVGDEWLVLGQYVQEEERGSSQRTWLLGTTTGRPALIVQFSFMHAPFKETYVVGSRLRGELAFWPSAAPLRAFVVARETVADPVAVIPTAGNIEEFLASVAAALARNPWQERFLCVLRDAIPVYDVASGDWDVREPGGGSLPLRDGEHWLLLSLSGGHPVTLAAEWDGAALLPLGVVAQGSYVQLAGVA